MFCTNCGNEVEQHARFCSKCGREVMPASQAQQARRHDMSMHINILGWMFVGCGVLFGLLGMIMIFAGQIIEHLPVVRPAEFPFAMGHFAGWLSAVVGLTTIALAAGVAAAGAGLLQYKSWARVVSIIMAILLLFKFPVGTAIAVYAFWVLFSQEGQEYYRTRAATVQL
jgi:predicted nucleic acid-binding Zn ribbon protein